MPFPRMLPTAAESYSDDAPDHWGLVKPSKEIDMFWWYNLKR